MVVLTFGMEILDGSVHTVIHRLPQITQEKAKNAGHRTEGSRDNVHHPNRICERLLQGRDAQPNDLRSDSWNMG